MNNIRLNKFGEMLKDYLENKNISINEFAERIETTPKNLIDIIEGRVTLSKNIIYKISFISNISVEFIMNIEHGYKIELEINEYLNKNNLTIRQFINKFDYKELKKKYNIIYNNEKNDYSIARSIFNFLRINNPNLIYKKDNTIFYKSKNDKPELLALWLEYCYRQTLKQEIKEYKRDNIQLLVKYIKEQASKNIFNKDELIKIFNENGIFLAIEDDLKGSKIRGAFRVLRNKPAIYITKKHKRIADIYFALLHELAHCSSDFNRAKKANIVSLIDDIEDEDYEIRADNKALNWMVDDKLYSIIKNDYKNIDKYDVIKSFVFYRLAKDKILSYSSKLYQDNNKLI